MFQECSPEYLATFPKMFYDIPQNVWGHSLECLATFPRMFYDIPRNVWWHSPECLATFPGIFEDIPQNVWLWRHSPEYNIPSIPCIPFPILLFLFLYIAWDVPITFKRKLKIDWFSSHFFSITMRYYKMWYLLKNTVT